MKRTIVCLAVCISRLARRRAISRVRWLLASGLMGLQIRSV
jgi:hypothetical protein